MGDTFHFFHGGFEHVGKNSRHETARFHVDRTVGGDRYHRDSGRDAFAGFGRRKGEGKTHLLRQQLKANLCVNNHVRGR
jgi:hypothetical protein